MNGAPTIEPDGPRHARQESRPAVAGGWLAAAGRMWPMLCAAGPFGLAAVVFRQSEPWGNPSAAAMLLVLVGLSVATVFGLVQLWWIKEGFGQSVEAPDHPAEVRGRHEYRQPAGRFPG